MFRTVLCLLLGCGFVGSLAEAQPRPMSPVDMIEMPRLSNGALSPDGRHFAYLRSQTLWDANKIVTRLTVIETETGLPIDISLETEETDPDRPIWWKPDSSGFIFLKTPDGSEKQQAFFYDLERQDHTQLTQHAETVLDIIWHTDGRGFYFISVQQQPDDDTQLLADGWIIPPFESNANREIWSFDLESRSAVSVVAGPYSVRQVSVSRDGQSLIYSRLPDHRFDSIYRGDVLVQSRDAEKPVRWTSNVHGEGAPKLSPDGQTLAYIATVDEDGVPFHEAKVFLKRAGETPVRLLPGTVMEALGFAWDRSGKGLYIRGNTGLRANLYHYTLETGELRTITQGDQSLTGWTYDPVSDTHIAKIETAQSPGEYALMRDEETGFQPLTREYAHWPETFSMPRQEEVRWRSRWNVQIEGLLVYPIGYEPGKRYPLVTITHGGPQSSARFGNWFATSYLPVLAGQGYMVLLPNHRGGSGYGDRFLRDMAGRYFRNAHHDVMSGIDAMIDRGLADPDRLIKMGWSAGGHMVNKLITHTDRFKVASSGAGASDWLSLHGESDSRFARQFIFGGTPFSRDAPRSRYTQDSPLKNAWKVSTPTLFFVGENDTRVPPTQSILMYRAVRATGTPTVLYQAENEPHNFRKPANQLFKINTELGWFAGFALGERYEPVLPSEAFEIAPPPADLAQAATEPEGAPSP